MYGYMRGLFLFLPLTVFAGQSLVLTPGETQTVADANLPQSQSWRVEFQIHNWTLPPQGIQSAYVFYLSGTAAAAAIFPNGMLGTDRLAGFGITGAALFFVAKRAPECAGAIPERRSEQASGVRDMELRWNGYQQDSDKIVAFKAWSYSGGTLGSANTNAALAFLRVFSTIVPDGTRPPVTADSGDLQNLTFGSGAGTVQHFDGGCYLHADAWPEPGSVCEDGGSARLE